MSESTPVPASDERLLAALAHASILIAFIGPVVPLALWSSQRGRSDYVRRQSLHAMGYQTIAYWLYLLVVALLLFVMILAIVVWAFANADDPARLTQPGSFVTVLNIVLYAVTIGLLGVFGLVAVVVAVRVGMRGDGGYPWMSRWLDRYLEGGEEQAERWVAGMAHGSAAWMLFGAVIPLIVWTLEKDRSSLLRFHGLQALIFQLGYSLIFVGSLLLMFPLVIGLPFLLYALDSSAVLTIVVLVLLMLVLLAILAIQLLFPLYQTFAIWAGVRVIQGHEPRYPLLGRYLARRMATIGMGKIEQE